jgi:hypothetical protein
MLPEQCNECFDDITKKVDGLVNLSKNQILKMSYDHTIALEIREKKATEFFESQDSKFNDYLDKKDKRENRTSNFMIAALIIFAGVIGYLFDKQSTYQRETDRRIEIKANKDTLRIFLSIKSARELNDIRDSYYRQLFVMTDKKQQTVDSTNYYWLIRHYLGDQSRGATIKSNNEFYKDQEPFKSEKK